jgi:membrane associated rhomboid family serine protease
VSYALPFTLLPIPLASEAFGTSKPYTTWSIAVLTIIASLAFLIYTRSDESRPGKELMLWSPYAHVQTRITLRDVDDFLDALGDNPDFKAELQDRMKKLEGSVADKELKRAAVESFIRDQIRSTRAEFHWWQLITHAFLHDTSSIWGFITHLLGNMLFLMVFGTRVNALIGNVATAFLYPILAAAAGWAQIWMSGDGGIAPMLGASGAINGLAGMYLILFPAHRLFCAMWIRLWFFFGFRPWTIFYTMKVFVLRGFWVLLIYLGYDLAMNWVQSREFGGGGVAHWAHIGGFLSGALIALSLLLSRMFNCRGGDLMSVLLGKHAWPFIGKPSRWKPEPTIEELAGRAIRLDYKPG